MITSLMGAPTVASAAPADAQPILASKTTTKVTARAGETIPYVINFSCSNNEQSGDGCDGAVFSDPLPKFIDIYGDLVPLEFVSASASATVWPTGFSLDTSDPLNPFVTGTAGPWPPGNSGSIFVTLRVPNGIVPVGPQDVTNTAYVTDPIDAPAYVDPSTTATTSISATAPAWTVSKSGPPSARMNRDVTWTVSVCAPGTAALFPNYSVTDTLPPGLQFVAAGNGGTYTDDNVLPVPADAVSDGAGVVTWVFDGTNRPPLGGDGCFRSTVTGRFPSGYVDPSTNDAVNDDNVGDARKTDVATGVGQATTDGPSTPLGEASVTTVLVGPVFGIGDGGIVKRFTDTSGNDNFYTQVGDAGRFNLSASIDSDFDADRLVITDGTWTFDDGTGPVTGTGMPESFSATSVTPGTWNAPITATIEGSNDGFVTTSVIGADVASGAPALGLATPYRSIRWMWGDGPGSVPKDFAAIGLQITGTIGSPAPATDDPGTYTNTSTMGITRGEESATATSNDQYVIEAAQPHPSIDKAVANSSRSPGQTTTYTLAVSNSPDATGVLTNPYVEDCVPAHFTIQGSPNLGAGWSVGPLPPCPPGQTPLRFDYTGTLDPGGVSSAVTYVALVDGESPGPITPPGDYRNTAFVKPSGSGAFAHCGNTNPFCGDTATVTVLPVVELNSQKCVSGDLDGGIFRPSPGCEVDPGGAVVAAQTLPGGLMDWELRLRNSGNTDATNVEFIDLFPRVGDTAVVAGTNGNLNPRNSEYQPYLVSEIIAPSGWTVSYSTSSNPCRPEVGGVNSPGTNCELANWVTNPPTLSLPTYRSVKLSYGGTLKMGESASFGWSTRAPVTDSTYDQGGTSTADPYEFLRNCTTQTPRTDPTHCPRAVNSFAYGADATNLPPGVPQPPRLSAEPPQVEVRVVAPPTPNAVGNRVWFDRNNDGLQAADTTPTGEPGVPGAYVELYRFDPLVNGGTYDLIGYTFTDANGNYLFSGGEAGLPDGTYKIRFVPPTGYYVSPADQTGDPTDQGAPGPSSNPGTNTDDDSDVDRLASGVGPLGEFHDSVDFVLGDNPNTLPGTPLEGETDLTWDVGIWRPLPAVDIAKVTKDAAWPDNQAGDGVSILRGREVTWIYTVANIGNTRLEDLTLTDDGGPDSSFGITDCTITSPGTNADGLISSAIAPFSLNRGATMRCTATGTAAASDYANTAAALGTPKLDDGTPILKGTSPATVTDSDTSSYVSGKYDLALAKTVGTIDLGTGNVDFTITVRNEGTVGSGPFQVTDVLPPGMSLVSGTVSPAPNTLDDATIVWDRPNLAPLTNTTIAFTAHIDDYLQRPFRNYAEISADSSALVRTGGVSTPTTDWDSTPDADISNDNTGNGVAAGNGYGPVGSPNAAVDNATITEAGSRLEPDSGDDAADGQDDADIADVAPVITYDLALAKVAPNGPVGLGENPTFQVRVYNQGNVPSGPVTVRDQLPTGLSFTSTGSTSGCSAGAANTVTCTLASIAPGASTLLTLATDVTGAPADYSTAPWRNWAEIANDSAQALYGVDDVDSVPEDEQGNGIGQDTTLPGDDYSPVTTAGSSYGVPTGADEDDNDDAVLATSVRYDLALVKTANATLVAQDGTITYTVTVENQGSVPSGTYVVTDTVPGGLGFVSSPDSGVFDDSGDPATVTFQGTNLAPGEDATFTWVAQVTDVNRRPFRNYAEISRDSALALYGITDADSTPDSDVTNDGDYGPKGDLSDIDSTAIADAGVRGGDPSDDADIADVDLEGLVYDLALAKVADTSAAALGDIVTYTITVQNQGNLDSKRVVITDWIPAGFEVMDLGGATDNTDGTIAWTFDDITAGATATRTFTARVVDVTKGPYRNIAEITEDGADFYDVTVGNIVDVEDIDSVPDSNRDNDGTYGPVGVAGPIDNTGPDAIGAAGGAGDPSDDADIADVAADVVYDLALVKTGPATMTPLGTTTFTVQVLNQGNVPSGRYDVTDTVPIGMEAIAASDGGSLDSPTTAVTWNALDSLDPGETATLTVEMRINDLTKRPFVNTAEIGTDGASLYDVPARDAEPGRPATPAVTVRDADSVPNTDPADDVVVDQTELPDTQQQDPALDEDDHDVAPLTTEVVYDLALAKTVAAPTIAYDGTATFTITVVNQGNVPSVETTVVDSLPDGTAFVSAGQGGTKSPDGRAVTWALGDLAPGAQTQLTLIVRPTDLTKRPYLNVAEITADGAGSYTAPGDVTRDVDSVPGDAETSTADNTAIGQAGGPGDIGFDDEDVAEFDVPVTYDLALVKTIPAGQDYRKGSVITFEVRVRNQGNVPSGLYSVQDVVPPGMSFVAASNEGVMGANGAVVWTDLPSLEPGATASLTVQLRLDDVTLAEYRNIAEVIRDSAGDYSTPTTPVTDKDSVPDADPNNDAVIDTDELESTNVPGDEDDHDIAMLDVTAILQANAVAVPATPAGSLPYTGAEAVRLVELGLLALALGAGAVWSSRRWRRRGPIGR